MAEFLLSISLGISILNLCITAGDHLTRDLAICVASPSGPTPSFYSLETRYLVTIAHKGGGKLMQEPCEVLVDISGNEGLPRLHGDCHGLEGGSGS
ncbi:Uncharacterized protein TCM_009332 [Theobroma cacao]|uniref:Uncharacterized protein n=1 Tax=Theobroma cacao TaxID=3641 RepID=A0A061E4Q6_THECC|nr:Uncharacterized protein TCM_009332 [Theobroma cacao]